MNHLSDLKSNLSSLAGEGSGAVEDALAAEISDPDMSPPSFLSNTLPLFCIFNLYPDNCDHSDFHPQIRSPSPWTVPCGDLPTDRRAEPPPRRNPSKTMWDPGIPCARFLPRRSDLPWTAADTRSGVYSVRDADKAFPGFEATTGNRFEMQVHGTFSESANGRDLPGYDATADGQLEAGFRRPEKLSLGSAGVLVYPNPIWIFRFLMSSGKQMWWLTSSLRRSNLVPWKIFELVQNL